MAGGRLLVGARGWRVVVVVACVALVMALLPGAADAKPGLPEHAQGRAVGHGKEKPSPPAHRQVPDHATLRAPAHANVSQDGPCTVVTTSSGVNRATCLFTDYSSDLINGAAVDLQDVVAAAGGTADSKIAVRAWGSKGGDGFGAASGGAAGWGGYAATYLVDLDSYRQANPFGSSTVWFYLARAQAGGVGGASTVVLFGPSATGSDGSASAAPVPCVVAQSGIVNGAQATIPAFSNGAPCADPTDQTLLLDAGGGGGGGQEGQSEEEGGNGGGGGVAVAAGSSVVSKGEQGHDGWDANGFGHAGSETGACTGGAGGQPEDGLDRTRNGGSGTDGIGGAGGGAETHPRSGYQIPAYAGWDVHGTGGSGSDDYGGGGGGGGCGGGGGGGGTANHGAGGGGGGGSFAYHLPGAGAPPSWATAVVAAPQDAGALMIVVDDVAAPRPETAQRP